MLTIGLIGGVASGKSTVARLLAEHGAVVIDADRLAHDALEVPALRSALVDRWGNSVLSVDGRVDRLELAKIVFGDSPQAIIERRFLERLVHPEVLRQIRERVAEHAAQGGCVVVLDVPLLLDVGWRDEVDLIVMVDCPQAVRLARAAERGWNADQFALREGAQMPISDKCKAADATVKNDGGLEDLRPEVARFWREQVEPRLAE